MGGAKRQIPRGSLTSNNEGTPTGRTTKRAKGFQHGRCNIGPLVVDDKITWRQDESALARCDTAKETFDSEVHQDAETYHLECVRKVALRTTRHSNTSR